MLNIVLLLVVFLLIAIVLRLAHDAATLRKENRKLAKTIRKQTAIIADYESAIWEWVDYADNLKDRLHGVDSYVITKLESKELPLFDFDGKTQGKTQPIATHNVGGYALPANESKPTNNGNGHKAESKSIDSSKHSAIIAKLGKIDNDQTIKAIALLDKWIAKDGSKAESNTDEYLKRLHNALKIA
jgi:hypothetical protein